MLFSESIHRNIYNRELLHREFSLSGFIALRRLTRITKLAMQDPELDRDCIGYIPSKERRRSTGNEIIELKRGELQENEIRRMIIW